MRKKNIEELLDELDIPSISREDVLKKIDEVESKIAKQFGISKEHVPDVISKHDVPDSDDILQWISLRSLVD